MTLLTTERLILRKPQEDDFAAIAAFQASERSKFVGGPTTDEWQLWRGFLSAFGHWALRGYGFFTATLKDNTIVGRVGLVNHIMWQEPELGWHIFDGYVGQGYAFEAASKIRHWAAETLGFNPLISYIHPDNTRSIALAERLGATLEGKTELLGSPCHIYRHPKIEVSQ